MYYEAFSIDNAVFMVLISYHENKEVISVTPQMQM